MWYRLEVKMRDGKFYPWGMTFCTKGDGEAFMARQQALNPTTDYRLVGFAA